jgi:hypothetical protein
VFKFCLHKHAALGQVKAKVARDAAANGVFK